MVNVESDWNQLISIRWKSVRVVTRVRRPRPKRPWPPEVITPLRWETGQRSLTTRPATRCPLFQLPGPTTPRKPSTRSVRSIRTRWLQPKTRNTKKRNTKWRKHRQNVRFRLTPVIHCCLFASSFFFLLNPFKIHQKPIGCFIRISLLHWSWSKCVENPSEIYSKLSFLFVAVELTICIRFCF